MSKIKVKIEVRHEQEIETDDFDDAWHDKCDADSTVRDDGTYPDMPDEFAVEQLKADLDSGEQDLDTILESATIEVTKV